MSSVRFTWTLVALCLLLISIGGCARPVVRPSTPGPGMAPPLPGPTAGSVAENDMQAVQAQLKVIYFDYDTYALSPQAQTDLQYQRGDPETCAPSFAGG